MRSPDFLSALTKAMPSRVELEAHGLESNEIDAVQKTFKYFARDHSEGRLKSRSELENMILENDCSSVEVGLIRFLDRPREHRDGVQVAFCEADSIVVRPSGSVIMSDHAVVDKGLDCAVDSERFLAALAAFIALRQKKSKWKERTVEAADICANLAGGRDYAPFFRLLCGFLD